MLKSHYNAIFHEKLRNFVSRFFCIFQITQKAFIVERIGDMILPTEILVKFADGKEQLLAWNGKDYTKIYKFSKAIESVQIDPKNKILLDLNVINNSRTLKQSSLPFLKYAMKIMFWLQNLI